MTNQWWAFTQMGLMPSRIKTVVGLQFFKLMGSGAGQGFSLRPDFSTYCLLAIWDQPSSATDFFEYHKIYQQFCQKSTKQCTFYLNAIQVKGQWNKKQPFQIVASTPTLPIAVITRASINRNRLIEFWRHVPENSRSINEAEGLLFSKGIGELPLIEQATFSVWQNKAAMQNFAYKNKIHKETIRKTHARNWYKEEMFVEFQVRKTIDEG